MTAIKKRLFKPGFTLIELLVVIAILGILSTIGIGAFVSSQVKSRDAKRKGDLQAISQALEMYSNDHGGLYPLSFDPTDPAAGEGEIFGCGVTLDQACAWGDEFGNNEVDDLDKILYMPMLPQSVNGHGQYYYFSTTGSSYILYAPLENTLDREAAKFNDESSYYDPRGDGLIGECGGENCNYGIHSTNTSLPDPVDPSP